MHPPPARELHRQRIVVNWPSSPTRTLITILCFTNAPNRRSGARSLFHLVNDLPQLVVPLPVRLAVLPGCPVYRKKGGIPPLYPGAASRRGHFRLAVARHAAGRSTVSSGAAGVLEFCVGREVGGTAAGEHSTPSGGGNVQTFTAPVALTSWHFQTEPLPSAAARVVPHRTNFTACNLPLNPTLALRFLNLLRSP